MSVQNIIVLSNVKKVISERFHLYHLTKCYQKKKNYNLNYKIQDLIFKINNYAFC